METQAPSLGRIAAAILFAMSCFGATLFVWISFGGPVPLEPEGWRFNARFDQPVAENADVRISGVKVGRVIRSTPSAGHIDVLMELQDRYAPLPADARAIIRTKTLLGEAFIELSPGSPSAPKLREHAILAVGHVEPTQQLDQVLGAFDEPTRDALKRFLADFSRALRGRSQDLNDALGSAVPAVHEGTALVTTLDRQSADVERLIRETGVVLRAIGRREAGVQSLVDAGDRVLAVTARRSSYLTETVRELPPFLTELRKTLLVAEATARDAAPTLRVLRPVAPLLRPALVETSELAPSLRELFRELDPLITIMLDALPPTTRLVDAAGPLVEQLDLAGAELVPVVQLLGRYKRELVAQLANVAAATGAKVQQPDGVRRHYLRSLSPLHNEVFYGYEQRLPSNRHNPYLEPGGLQNLAGNGLRAWDCRNTNNPETVPVIGPGRAPHCLVQGPWYFQGETNAYPHVRREGR